MSKPERAPQSQRPFAIPRVLRGLAVAALALLGAAVPAGAATASVVAARTDATPRPATPPSRSSARPASRRASTTSSSSPSTRSTCSGIDDERRSTLTTTETLVAVFPDFDQNRGIRRYIPSTYDGHPLQNQVVSVTDENGQRRDFEQGFESDDSGSYQVLTIAVPEGQYVHGRQTYVIEYTQRDVTEVLRGHERRRVVLGRERHRLGAAVRRGHGDRAAAPTASPGCWSSTDCYFGPDGSTTQCEAPVDRRHRSPPASADLGPYQNMTIVAAFPAGTFAEAPFDIFAWVPAAGLHRCRPLARRRVILAFVLRFTVLRGCAGDRHRRRAVRARRRHQRVARRQPRQQVAEGDGGVDRRPRGAAQDPHRRETRGGLLRQRHDVRRAEHRRDRAVGRRPARHDGTVLEHGARLPAQHVRRRQRLDARHRHDRSAGRGAGRHRAIRAKCAGW